MTKARGILVAALVALPACSVPKTPKLTREIVNQLNVVSHARTIDDEFARRGGEILAGFPGAFEKDSFRIGDKLLYGIESFVGDEVSRYYLLLETIASADPARDEELHEFVLRRRSWKDGEPTDHERVLRTRKRSVRVTVFDEERRQLDAETSEVFCRLHELGLFAWARLHDTARGRRKNEKLFTKWRVLPPFFLRRELWGTAVARGLIDEMRGNGALVDLLGSLAIAPAWYEVIGGSIDMYVTFRPTRIVDQPVPGLPLGEQAYEISTSLWRYKRRMMVVYMVLVPAVGPMAMSSGIVTMAGVRGFDPSRRFVARLLAVAQGESR